ncbi:MAG: GNAT family N-acetyltransferase [Candidatus Beckwithbacteria bacterium]|nr:GNAT family N-acetyltransferase [Patescibacteria group bacterium]
MKQKSFDFESGEDNPPNIKNLSNIGSFLVSNPQLNQHYFSNGYSSLIQSLRLEIVSDIDQALYLWQKFSQSQTLFDTFEFRLAFFEAYNPRLHLVTLKNPNEIVGLLPLQYEEDTQKYYWFGSWWQEESKFLVKDELYIPLLLAVSPSPVNLNAISFDVPNWIKKVIDFKADDPKYILKLDLIKSLDDYLATLKKKKRYNLRRDLRIIEALKPEIIIDNFSDFDGLIELSKKRFSEKGEETDWKDPRRVDAFRKVIEFGRKKISYEVRMITVKIGSKLAAVDLVAIFNNCYYPIKCGYNVKDFPGIGNYVNLLEIKDAIELGLSKMDFLEIGYGWKDKWFESVPLLKYEK